MAKTSPLQEVGILDALSTLTNSSDEGFQLSALLAFNGALFLEDVEVIKVESKTLKPLIHLLESNDAQVQAITLNVLCRLAENGQNKKVIASSDLLVPLLCLSKSKNVDVQEIATAALKELAELEENKQSMVAAGTIPVMVKLLRAESVNVQLQSIIILNAIAFFDLPNLKKLAVAEVELVESLIALSDSTLGRTRQEASMAFGTLAREERFLEEIIRQGGLKVIRKHLLSTDLLTILGSLLCINEISGRPQHNSRLIDGGFLDRLKELLANGEVEEVKDQAALALFRLSYHRELDRVALVEAGVVERVQTLVPSASPQTQALMAMLICHLISSDALRPRLMSLGVLDILICCTKSSNNCARSNSINAIGMLLMELPDHQPFVEVWEVPEGGIHSCLLRSLVGTDETFRKLAIMAITVMLKNKNEKLRDLIKGSSELKSAIKRVAQVSGTAIPRKPTWGLIDFFIPAAFNIKGARVLLSMMEEGDS
ncbi:Vacuolar protein 8 [Mortierella sp. AD094]|nr:Vacuolar protein 8 [Mortierella sp. AD094]